MSSQGLTYITCCVTILEIAGHAQYDKPDIVSLLCCGIFLCSTFSRFHYLDLSMSSWGQTYSMHGINHENSWPKSPMEKVSANLTTLIIEVHVGVKVMPPWCMAFHTSQEKLPPPLRSGIKWTILLPHCLIGLHHLHPSHLRTIRYTVLWTFLKTW